MAMIDRAAQFAPFAAVVGYDDAIVETIESHPEVEITFFVADKRKSGGQYKTIKGNVTKIDSVEHCLYLGRDVKIAIADIADIKM